MFSLFLEVEEIERDMLVAELWDAGATGITEEPHALRAFSVLRRIERSCSGSSLILNLLCRKKKSEIGFVLHRISGSHFRSENGSIWSRSGATMLLRKEGCDYACIPGWRAEAARMLQRAFA